MKCPDCYEIFTEPFPRCPNCGQPVNQPEQAPKRKPNVALIYSGILIGWAVLFPFLVPIIIKKSLAHQQGKSVTYTIPTGPVQR